MSDQPKDGEAIEPEVSIMQPEVPSPNESTENTLIHQLTGGRGVLCGTEVESVTLNPLRASRTN
jgi:hypothetical protein